MKLPIKSCGNTLPEYALPALLVLFIGITAIQLFGDKFNGVFSAVRSDMKQSIQATEQANAKQAQAKAAFQQDNSTDGNLPANLSTTICDAKGNCVSVGNAMELKSTIEALGANGSIKVMASKLKLLSAYLLAQNQITPEQAGIFNDLANQSYKIGIISGLVEQTANTCGSNANCFNNTKVSYNGQLVSMQDLSNMIGYKPVGTGQTENNPEVNTLWNIYKSMPGQVWNNPALKDTVTTLTTQVAQTSNLVMWGTSNIQNGYMAPNGMHGYVVEQSQGSIPQSAVAQGASAASSINMDSTHICTSGKGRSNGFQCR